MHPVVTAALIVAAAIVVGQAVSIYFGPYQTCVRAYGQHEAGPAQCAKFTSGR